MSEQLDQIVTWFESLTPASLDDIASIYAPDALFKDPFNELLGIARIGDVYRHMFATLDTPRFVVEQRISEGLQAFLVWRFEFGLRGRAMTIRGGTHLLLDETGRIVNHRDYWDAAEELYERLPVLGTVLRWIKRRLAI